MSAPADMRVRLEEGELRLVGLLPRASNDTFLAEVVTGDRTVPIVYKPRGGETPLWDYPDGTLCHREVAAFLLAEALGWPNVPLTVLRDGPRGEGAVQLFVDHDPAEHYFTLRDRFADEFRRVAAFDAIVGNGDRKAGHCLLDGDGTVWVVDHGLCFAARPWLRTVIWDFAGELVPEEIADDVGRAAGELRSGELRERLEGLLAAEEVDAVAERAEALVRAGTFPHPGPGRSHPWPAV
jgi:Phosphatidylinositol 3- and 4-kinase